MTAFKQKPPESEPPRRPLSSLISFDEPDLRNYFISHWNWYTLKTIHLQQSADTLLPDATPHSTFMTSILEDCATVVMIIKSCDKNAALQICENWISSTYQLEFDIEHLITQPQTKEN